MSADPTKTDEVEVAIQAVVKHYGVDVQTFEATLKVAASILAALPDDLFEPALSRAERDIRRMATEIRIAARAH